MSQSLDGLLADVPVFALGAVLLPDDLLPLHVFEPRYRALVDAVRASHDHLLVGTIDTERSVADQPPVLHDVAGLGRIVRFMPMEDGRSMILLEHVETIDLLEEVSREDEPFRRFRGRVRPAIEPKHGAVDPSLYALGAQVLGGLDLPESLDGVAGLRGAEWTSAMARLLLQRPAERLAWLKASRAEERLKMLEGALVERLMTPRDGGFEA